MVRKTKKIQKESTEAAVVTINPLTHDLTVSLLIVSLVINLYVLIAWVMLQVTSMYDSEIAAFLFTR